MTTLQQKFDRVFSPGVPTKSRVEAMNDTAIAALVNEHEGDDAAQLAAAESAWDTLESRLDDMDESTFDYEFVLEDYYEVEALINALDSRIALDG